MRLSTQHKSARGCIGLLVKIKDGHKIGLGLSRCGEKQ